MKTTKQLLEGKDFEPHMMYHPETGEEEKAEKPEDHERLKKKGYSHEKPEVKEGQFYGQDKMAARAKSMMSPKTHVRLTREKGGYERATVLKKNKEKIAQLKKDGYKIDPTFAKESVDNSVMLEGKNLIPDFQKIVKTKGAAKVGGVMIDMFTASAITQAYDKVNPAMKKKMEASDVNKLVGLAQRLMGESMDDLHSEALDLIHENYRTLATKGMGAETKGSIKVGTEVDFYETERGDKLQGKIIKITPTGYVVQAMERGNTKKYTFKWHDRTKAKKLLEVTLFMENFRARRDAMKDMPKQGKDSADDDIEANDDDRKAASKNVLMQIRKASDLPKGGAIEFEGGKKGKISQDDAKKISKLFDILKKPSDKQKFQKVISKDLRSIQALIKRLGK